MSEMIIFAEEMFPQNEIERFLREVNQDFPVFLSDKIDIKALAEKYHEKATLCCAHSDNKIIAMVAGYTKNTVGQMGYISLVAVSRAFRHQTIASRLIVRFLEIGKNDGLSAVHVYTHATNHNAIAMYRKLGFAQYRPMEEPRPEDIHFIKYL